MNLKDFIIATNTYNKQQNKGKKKKEKLNIELFFDIETFTFNKDEGKKKPSKYQNQVFSVAVGFYYEDELYISHYANFIDMFNDIESAKLNTNATVQLIGHNINRYDNMYLLFQLLHAYPEIEHHSEQLSKAVDQSLFDSFKSLGRKKGDKIVLEKRVKSKTNLELHFTLGTCIYQTLDTLPKTSPRSLRSIGEQMNKMGLLSEDHTKTELDYTKYDKDYEMGYDESLGYAYQIFKQLNTEEMTYIDNDIYILAEMWKHFPEIFNGFDKTKMTFSQNVLDEYKVNPLAVLQLTNKHGNKQIKYTDYQFNGLNFYDYLKRFYKGGLNFYNDKYIGKIINRKIRSFDLNSSYPTSMYTSKIPTFLLNAESYAEEASIEVKPDNDNYFMYEITIDEFNQLVSRIKSNLVRKLIVKYYSSDKNNFYINTNTINIINEFSETPLKSIKVLSWLRWQCEYFGARSVIEKNYFIKSQGKNKHRLIMTDPTDFKVTQELNDKVFSKEEINSAKVMLNGIYGLPALRAYYNLFKFNPDTDSYVSFPNGFENTERNVIFSIYVTSKSLLNLLEPLTHFTSGEIDNYVYYGDTDSLYIDDQIYHKIDKSIVDPINLGYWDNEHTISQMTLLNHKKYAFYESDEEKIYIRSGGVNQKLFNLETDFNDFVENQFSEGVKVPALRSILTESGTMALYDGVIELDKGKSYLDYANKAIPKILSNVKENYRAELEKEENQNEDRGDDLYIETPYGILSIASIYDEDRPAGNRSIDDLIARHKLIKIKMKK